MGIRLGRIFLEIKLQKVEKSFLKAFLKEVNESEPTWGRGPICHLCFPSSLFDVAQDHLRVVLHPRSLLWSERPCLLLVSAFLAVLVCVAFSCLRHLSLRSLLYAGNLG